MLKAAYKEAIVFLLRDMNKQKLLSINEDSARAKKFEKAERELE